MKTERKKEKGRGKNGCLIRPPPRAWGGLSPDEGKKKDQPRWEGGNHPTAKEKKGKKDTLSREILFHCKEKRKKGKVLTYHRPGRGKEGKKKGD